MHYGSFPGYFSMITMVPSLNISIYSSINGGKQRILYTINSLIHVYALDLLMDERPWMSRSDACAFSHVPGNKTQKSEMLVNSSDIDTSVAPPMTLEAYAGQFYHPVFGILEVKHNETLNRLQMQYGELQYDLYYKENQTFYAEIQGSWFIPLEEINFRSVRHDVAHEVQIPFLEFTLKPVFEKMTMSDTEFKEMKRTCKTIEQWNGAGGARGWSVYVMCVVIITVYI